MRIAQWLHVLSTIVWVGGMFFAHVALRPSLSGLPPPLRLPLMESTLSRFFRWVAGAVATIIASGLFMIVGMGGLARVGLHVHLMTALGLVMAGIYVYIVAQPFPALRAAVRDNRWEDGARALADIRRLVGVNLVLGLVTITIAILGHGVVWE